MREWNEVHLIRVAVSGSFLWTQKWTCEFPKTQVISCPGEIRNSRFQKYCAMESLFCIFCWPCISLQILGNNELDALLHVFIYFMSLPVSSVTALIIRRSNCINTLSGMISLCKWLLGMPVRHTKQSLTQTNHTRWCINAIRSSDDERCAAQNM